MRTPAQHHASSNAWYARNREAIRARRKLVAAANPERIRLWNRQAYERHLESRLIKQRAYHAARRVEQNAAARAYQGAHREEIRTQQRAYYVANRSQRIANAVTYQSVNRGKKRAWHAKRRAAKLRATPILANPVAIAAIYADAVARTRETGVKYVVDHYYPLVSPVVCGLHVESNLRILEDTENLRKHNKHPDRIAA